MWRVFTLSERSQHRYWSNAEANTNIICISVTDPMFHEPMGWLNATADQNMPDMVVTDAVFHELMSSLKVLFS